MEHIANWTKIKYSLAHVDTQTWNTECRLNSGLELLKFAPLLSYNKGRTILCMNNLAYIVYVCYTSHHQPSFFRYIKLSLSCATSSSSVRTRLPCSSILNFCSVKLTTLTTTSHYLTFTSGNLDWRYCSLCCLQTVSFLNASVCWLNISILWKGGTSWI